MTADSDLDALLESVRYLPGRCHVAQDLDLIDDEERRAKVAAAARDRMVPPARVKAAFELLLGHAPSQQSAARHRKGACACP